jgi:hypothetical protein
MPLDSDSDNDNNNEDEAHIPSPLHSQFSSLTLGPGVLVTPVKKEHSISARIKAIYMLNEK